MTAMIVYSHLGPGLSYATLFSGFYLPLLLILVALILRICAIEWPDPSQRQASVPSG